MNENKEVIFVIEERLDRMETMLSQLINMVGNLNEEQQEMKKDLQLFREEQLEMKKDLQSFREEQQEMKKDLQLFRKEQLEMKTQLNDLVEKSEERHQEVQANMRDQDFIWEKTVRNEREIESLKRL